MKIKKDEHNMFTTKSYVSIQTLPIHNRKVCVNPKHHLFISKRYVPIRNWNTTMKPHIFYLIKHPTFYLNLVFKPIMSSSILDTWRIKLMKNKNRWKNKMNKTYSQPIVICQSEFYLFTTKRYVSTQTPHVHFQEVCSH
jgi:hypothetical protein